MPPARGRKKRPRDRRREHRPAPEPDAGQPHRRAQSAPAPGRPEAQAPLPSNTARATGFLISIATAFVGAIVAYNGATGGLAAGDAAFRIAGGLALMLLAAVVGVLCLFPAPVRDWLARRRTRRDPSGEGDTRS